MLYWIILSSVVQKIEALPSFPGLPSLPGVPGLPGLPGLPITGLPEEPTPRPIQDLNPGEVDSCANQISAAQEEVAKAVDDPTVDCPPGAPARKRKRDLDIYDANNACLPLTSANPVGNPYHPDLIGVDPNTVLTREGYGRGFALDGQINTKKTGGAVWSLTRSISFTKSTMIGVSYSDGTSNTQVNGSSWTDSNSKSYQQSLSNMLEKSYSNSKSFENSGSFATELQKSLTKVRDDSLSDTQTFANDFAKVNAITWNENVGKNTMNENGYEDSATTGTDKTVGYDRSKDHMKSTSVTSTKTVTCTFTKSSSAQNGLNDEYRWTVGVGGSLELSAEAGIPKVFLVGGSINAHIDLGAQGAVTTTASITKENHKSVTVTYTITKSSTDSKTSRCSSNGNTVTHDTQVKGSHHNTQDGTSYNKENGGSYTETLSGSESNANAKTISDSISDAITRGDTSTDGWSQGVTDVYGGSTSNGITSVTDIGATFSNTSDFSTSIGISRTIDNNTQITDTTTWEISQGVQYNIEKDQCLIPVCMPNIKSTVVSFICVPPNVFDAFNQPVREVVVTEVQRRQIDTDSKNNNFDLGLFDLNCNIRWIKCTESVSSNEPVFAPGTWYNYIENQGIHSDNNFTSDMATELTGTNYYFGWGTPDGSYEFQVKKKAGSGQGIDPANDGSESWRTGLKLSNQLSKVHLKITDDGHINIYADGVYAYPDGSTSKDDLVWSSLPYHMDYPVGTYGNRNQNKNFGYRLTISKNGIPELYDSVYVKVWSGDKDFLSGNKHAHGYKFPTTVPYPLAYPPTDLNDYCNYRSSDNNEKNQIDPHNDKPENIKWIGNELTYRTILNENEGIRTPDFRFTLHLSTSGNLILKEGCRTMWETSTANRWFGERPFKAMISSKGELFIKDFKSRAIWNSIAANNGTIFKIKISETGNIEGSDKSEKKVWQSRQDDEIGNHWTVWDIPTAVFDDEAEKPKREVFRFPLVNLYNGRCIKIGEDSTFTTGVVNINTTSGATDFSDCQLWDYSEDKFTYVPTGTEDKCMGPTSVQTCSKYSLWRHYDDGLLVNVETAQCLNGTAALIPCTKDKLRVDKLWSRGFQAVTTLATNATNIFLQGQMYYQRNMGFRYYPDKNKNLIFQVFDYNRPKIKIYQYSLNTNVNAKDGTFIRLLSNGLSANVTAFPRTDGQQTQAGVLPFRLDLNDKSLSVLDANNKPLWYWNFRK